MTTPAVLEIDVPATTLVGVTGKFTSGMAPNSNAHEVIPGLWQKLMELVGPSMHDAHWSAGVMSDDEASSSMNYFAGIRLDDHGGHCDGLETLELPGGSYVACEHIGSLDSLGETTVWFYSQYLPSSGHVLRDGPHLEIYDERFNPDSDDSVVLICAPV